jgi:hypothetical protein
MEKELFVTAWKERQRFEEELIKIASKQLDNFSGMWLMSWISDKKEPVISDDFMDSLPVEIKIRVERLIESLN